MRILIFDLRYRFDNAPGYGAEFLTEVYGLPVALLCLI